MDYSEFPLLDFLSTKKKTVTRAIGRLYTIRIFADNAHNFADNAYSRFYCASAYLHDNNAAAIGQFRFRRELQTEKDQSQHTGYCSCPCWGSRSADHLVSAEGADREKQDLSLLQLCDAHAMSK